MNKQLKTIALTTAATAGALFCINKLINTLSISDNILGKTRGYYYDWRFGKIYYTKQGSGRPLLLIHDLNSSSSAYEWKHMIQLLSKDHTVYAVDLLGCGRSDKPNLTYTNYLYVQMVSDFIKNIICRKTDIIATGISGSFVIMACHNDPELIDKMIIINPESLQKLNQIPTKKSKVWKFYLEIPILGMFTYNMLHSKDRIGDCFRNKYYCNISSLNEKDIDAYHEACHLGKSTSRHLFASMEGKYTNINILHALKELDNSIYLVGGEEEADIDQILKEYTYFNPAIEITQIRNTRHLPQLENPVALYNQIKIYLD